MQVKKTLCAMGAILAVAMGASPASAKIFQYTALASNTTLTINTITGTGTITGPEINIRFTSNDILSFKGGYPIMFSLVFTSMSGSSKFGSIINTNLELYGTYTARTEVGYGPSGQYTLLVRGVHFSGNNAEGSSWRGVDDYKEQLQGGQ